MNLEERSLLLYIESRSVDDGGLLDSRHINEEERAILKAWKEQRFIQFERVSWESIQSLSNRHQTDKVVLSDKAWKLAHKERKAKGRRVALQSPYCNIKTTSMLRS